MQQQKNDKTTCLLLALTTIFWGSLYTASKVLLDVIQPFTLLCLRYIIAAIAMTILQRLRKPDSNGKPRRIKGGDWKYVIMFGLGGYVLSIGLQQYGTKLAGASLASLINCMNPIAICFFAVLLLHERMTMKKVVCIVSAVAGAVCIVGGDAGGGHILGIALSLGSVLTWSALSVFMRSFSQKYDALTVTTYGIYVAAIGTLPLMLREIITHPEMDFLHAKYILVLFYVAIFCTTIPHSLWNYCLSRAEASTCSLFYPIQPLTSMVLGVLLLNEHMTVGFIAGAVLIEKGERERLHLGKNVLAHVRLDAHAELVAVHGHDILCERPQQIRAEKPRHQQEKGFIEAVRQQAVERVARGIREHQLRRYRKDRHHEIKQQQLPVRGIVGKEHPHTAPGKVFLFFHGLHASFSRSATASASQRLFHSLSAWPRTHTAVTRCFCRSPSSSCHISAFLSSPSRRFQPRFFQSRSHPLFKAFTIY